MEIGKYFGEGIAAAGVVGRKKYANVESPAMKSTPAAKGVTTLVSSFLILTGNGPELSSTGSGWMNGVTGIVRFGNDGVGDGEGVRPGEILGEISGDVVLTGMCFSGVVSGAISGTSS